MPDHLPAPDGTTGRTPALALADVGLRRGERWVLSDVNWTVAPDERWVVLGANGSGKTTLVRVAALVEHPSTGTVDVLGERLGRTDVRVLRRRIGLSSAALADRLRPTLSARDVVMTARYGALEPWWDRYTDDDRADAEAQLARLGVADRADQPFGTLSSGERQRVLLARTLVGDPGILLLDEAAAGLDVAGREELVAALGGLAADPAAPALVLVTHHLEEVPPGVTHALALRDGRVLAAGPVAEVVRADVLSACYGLVLEVDRHDAPTGARWSARARR